VASRGGGAKPPLREVRDPVGQALAAWRRHIAGASGVPLPAAAAWVPGRKSPRWSAERGPGRTGTGPRIGSAGVAPRKRDRTKECACRRSTRPSSGGRIGRCRRGDGLKPAAASVKPGGDAATSEGTKEKRQGKNLHADMRRGNERCCAARAAKRAV